MPSDQCVAPTLDYSALTTAGSGGSSTSTPRHHSPPPAVGELWGIGSATRTPAAPCTGGRVNISTVLLLEDTGATNYQVVVELNVEAEPGRDSCLPAGSPTDGQCCITRNLAAESQFEVNSRYLYGVVDLPVGPNMIQIHESVGHPGYLLNRAEYTQNGDTALRKSGNPTRQPLRMFQFIIGESRFSFAHQ